MVLDAGGGTVDVSMSFWRQQGTRMALTEAVRAGGRFCGGVFVDEDFL